MAPRRHRGQQAVISMRRLGEWWLIHRVLRAVAAAGMLLGGLLVIHRATAGWWLTHSRTVLIVPSGSWRVVGTVEEGGYSFTVSSSPGSNGSACFRLDTVTPPLSDYSTVGYDHGCSFLGDGAAQHLSTVVSVDPSLHPAYGLIAAAVSTDVDSVVLHVRTDRYDQTASMWATADIAARISNGLAIVTFPATDTPLSVTVTSDTGRSSDCQALGTQAAFFVEC